MNQTVQIQRQTAVAALLFAMLIGAGIVTTLSFVHDRSVSTNEMGRMSDNVTRAEYGEKAGKLGPLAGVEVGPLGSDAVQQLRLPPGASGVIVESVETGSPASDAGLRNGDVIARVNGEPIKDVGDYGQTIERTDKLAVVLQIFRDGKTAIVVVQATQ